MSPAPTSFFCVQTAIQCDAIPWQNIFLHCEELIAQWICIVLHCTFSITMSPLHTVIHWNNILNSSAIVHLHCSLLHCSFSQSQWHQRPLHSFVFTIKLQFTRTIYWTHCALHYTTLLYCVAKMGAAFIILVDNFENGKLSSFTFRSTSKSL